MTVLLALMTFAIVALASQQIGTFGRDVRLPLITGYIAAGVFVGPFALDIVHEDVLEDLRFVDAVSLGIIAFAAGSEMYLPELKGRLRSIAWITIGQLIVTFVVGSAGIFLLTDFIPFTQDFPTVDRVAVSILAGTILVARSPASAIAIVSELRAKGPFTKTVLGVTVTMDVVIIILFAVNTSIATALFNDSGFNLTFLLALAIDLSAAVGLGYLVYRALEIVLASQLDQVAKIAMMLTLGYGVFFLSTELIHFSEEYLPFKLLIEPLLAAMIGSFLITNYSLRRAEFARLLERVAPSVYVLFFTFTGVSLQLDILVEILFVTLVIALVRLGGLMLGSYGGSLLAREPANRRRIMWMSFIPQAGVALGLAREAADEFPVFGEEFATLIIAGIVLNQLVGPPFLKFAIKQAGEANIPEQLKPDRRRDAVIFGVGRHALALARQLRANEWRVVVADLNQDDETPNYTTQDMDIRYIDSLDDQHLDEIITVHTDAVVAMMRTDEDNLRVCQYICDHLSGTRLSVRLNDPANMKPFLEMGAMVVNPTDAIIALLDQSVRAPQSAALFMHRDPAHEIVQVTITDPVYDHIPLAKLRLPPDVLVLNIMRDGHSIVPHGYTKLRLNDEVTLLGDSDKLRDTILRLGY